LLYVALICHLSYILFRFHIQQAVVVWATMVSYQYLLLILEVTDPLIRRSFVAIGEMIFRSQFVGRVPHLGLV